MISKLYAKTFNHKKGKIKTNKKLNQKVSPRPSFPVIEDDNLNC